MSSTAISKTITELRVSAHLMTLDAGLFCVFNSPGAPPPDAATGLPGVRLSAAPAPAGFGGEVGISGFNAGGWLGGEDGAALVRVVGGPAQVLVTVYQDPAAQHDAPKLQVIRLNEGAEETVASAPAQQAGTTPPVDTSRATAPATGPGKPIEVAAHIYGRGDVGGTLGEWMGERGSKRWIEGFGLAPGGGVAASDIEYQAVLGRDWLSPWAEGGQFCGSRGMSLPILGLRVRLRGAAARTHALALSAAFVDGTEIGPVPDGEACEAPTLSPLEAFRVTLRPLRTGSKAAAAPVSAKPATSVRGRRKSAAPTAAPTAASAAPPSKAAQPAASIAASKAMPAKAMPAKATPKPGRKPAGAKPAVAAPPPKAAATRRR